MVDKVPIEELEEAMYNIVKEYSGKKKFKPGDLTKEMIAQFGEDRVTKKECKDALKELIDSGRLVYGYYGGTSVELPHVEGAAKDI
ncbi:MAG: hypothetical protein HY999_04255 [Nitrospinae bacterium]|nr:hypothetical protein [Nitrospinota bacterium]